ncbi:MAG TPA: putative 2OG-Fe(II) oxygenase [Magnetospirillaceae bacterium]|jgi:tetratricopeptide (TPR) repeat protein
MTQSRGIVYVATKLDRYVEEAFLSAESAKQRYPDLSITLFTDRTENALCAMGCFDRVETIEGVTGFQSGWAEGQLNRLKALSRTPYDRTLHLDTDTRIFSKSLLGLFDLLDKLDVAMVEDPPDNSYARRKSGRAMFNAGFVLYRKTDQVWAWLADWAARTEQNFHSATEATLPEVACLAHIPEEEVRRALLRMDQTSLMEILSPDRNAFGLKLRILDPAWNYRGSRLDAYRRKTVEILHSHALKKTMPDLLVLAGRWAADGDARAERLYDYVAMAQPAPAARKAKGIFGLSRAASTPDPREGWSNPMVRRGDLHLRYGQMEPARQNFQAALFRDPNDIHALAGGARVALRAGRVPDALSLIELALAADRDSVAVNAIHGEILVASGQTIDAIAPLTKAQKGGDAHAAFLLGQAWFALKDYGKAATAYESALVLNPDHGGAANNYTAALLGRRKYAAVVAHTDALLAKRPWHVSALAFKCLALAELGRNGDAAAIADLEGLVKVERLTPPSSEFRSVEAFNKALAQALVAEPSLVFEPKGHTTRFGLQSGNLADHPAKAVQTLNTLILNAVRERTNAVKRPGEHPFDRAVPQNYTLYSWVTILDDQGHQTPHMHVDGWLSGVYYVDVPEAVMADTATEQGWLVFGPGDERWQRPETKTIERAIRPEPGLLVTFPSFFWHSTRPLRGPMRRISYAFDIVPE